MKKDNLKVNNINLLIILITLLIIFFSLLYITKDSKIIDEARNFISNDVKILYITDDNNYKNYPIEILKKYDIDYLYINSTNLSRVEKTKIEKIINSKYLSNIIVVYKDGKIVDAIIEYKNEEVLINFFQLNDLIPMIIGDNEKIIEEVNNLLKTDYSLIYLPYKYKEEVNNQDLIFSEISTEYEINYKKIDAYLLSKTQQNKLNSILQISSVEDQIVILVKDKKIIGSIRGINNKLIYLDELKKFNFIDQIILRVINIDYDNFNNLLNDNNKNIIVIGKDECKYCEEVNFILNDIGIEYDIKVNYINVGKLDSNISKEIEKKLIELGYNDGFTTPITLIVENNKLINYVIGLSNKQYFIDIFIENGIIK